MKIKVMDSWYEYASEDRYNPYYGSHTYSVTSNDENWQEMDVDIEELNGLIDKGYKIKINC